MNPITVFARDISGNTVGMIDGYNKVSAVRRLNKAGNWMLEIEQTQFQTSLMSRYAGISLVQNGSTIFSGFVTSIKRTKSKGSDRLTYTGMDDFGLLSTRLAYPDPAGAPYGFEFDSRTEIAEKIIKEYVNYNMGALALAARRIAGLSIETDYSRGTSITGRARFDKMDEFIATLANQGGVIFEIIDMVAKVRVPVGLTGKIVLSEELGTLDSYEYEAVSPDLNYDIVGGAGDGVARVFADTADGQSIIDWRRVEGFLNYDKSSTVSELVAAGIDDMLQHTGGSLITVSSSGYKGRELFTDYQIGDTIMVVIDGVEFNLNVVEGSIELAGDGSQTILPAFSSSFLPNGLLHSFDKSAYLQKRVGRLERN